MRNHNSNHYLLTYLPATKQRKYLSIYLQLANAMVGQPDVVSMKNIFLQLGVVGSVSIVKVTVMDNTVNVVCQIIMSLQNKITSTELVV